MMPSKGQYGLAQNDDYYTRVQLHPDEAFHQGITFHVKFVGMMEVARPTSRVEIVAAMRKIRYEFKVNGLKKRKVRIDVSVNGVEVAILRKKKRRYWLDDNKPILSDPIYRIFYVSHDSQDMKIFSYIARDGTSNIFKCMVFKSNKKNQAMRIVRTIGQAFEVCHKLSINSPDSGHFKMEEEQDAVGQDLFSPLSFRTTKNNYAKVETLETTQESLCPHDASYHKKSSDSSDHTESIDMINTLHQQASVRYNISASPSCETVASQRVNKAATTNFVTNNKSTLLAQQEMQLLRKQLEQQDQQMKDALSKLQLTRDQLCAEQSARLQAQARNHQLLVQNRELMDYVASLISHLQGGTCSQDKTSTSPLALDPATIPQVTNNHIDKDSSHTPLSKCANGKVLPQFVNNEHGIFDSETNSPCLSNKSIPRVLKSVTQSKMHPLATSPYAFVCQQTTSSNFELASDNAHWTKNLQMPPGYLVPENLYNAHNYPLQTYPVNFNTQPTMSNPYSIPEITSLNHSPTNFQYMTFDPEFRRANSSNQKQIDPRLFPSSGTESIRNTSTLSSLRALPRSTGTECDCSMRTTRISPKEFRNILLKQTTARPTITRSTSEKVSNRSELMSEVQRTMWARHTTK